MSLSLAQLKTDRDWRSSTGLSQRGRPAAKFTRLLTLFMKAYQAVYEVDIAAHQANLKKEFVFDTYQDLLFYVLFCLKNPTVYQIRGLIFGLSASTADYNFEKGLALLEKALDAQLPARQFGCLTAFLDWVQQHSVLTIDVTEVRIQRQGAAPPKDNQRQKDSYSGKKSTIPIKS
jgi:hypothetical protein